ncbi:Oxoglutarate dehydrogenase inhibitor [Aquisphaera giovannonii]|uniref:Oxoglutarate dehydrogenase inhibitor n=1 Tax=Aquisphaera giovannonii TaxID=406548 RepID=A0A5B9W0X5_9BACT|nr:FHA domain-containing protein [Aquisphaera giovannonii]QEH34193.1 Oxoglutarate dehydrogenase inhibitor [Aquisphaera giovannonii]
MSSPSSPEPLRLSSAELFSPQVESYLEEQAVLSRAMPEVVPRPFLIRVLYSSYFYLSLASGLGALVGWMILEPFFDDKEAAREGFQVANLLLFPVVLGSIGLFLGAAEGIMCRNLQRAAISAAVGLGVGFAGGLVALIVASIMFIVVRVMIVNMFPKDVHEDGMPTGMALLMLMMGRASAWAVAAIPAGIGQGIALRERKVALNGLLGGVLGGLLGGIVFDPISVAFTGADGEAWLSRGIGFTIIGLMVGFFVGIVEQWTKTAWLLMKAGPLAGKQFVIFRNPMVLGSSPKADVYLFKDEAIEPRHALIHDRGGRFEIEDMDSADGTYVNGIPVKKQILKAGDQIVLGKTVLEFALREA